MSTPRAVLNTLTTLPRHALQADMLNAPHQLMLQPASQVVTKYQFRQLVEHELTLPPLVI